MITSVYFPDKYKEVWSGASEFATRIGATRNELIIFLLKEVINGRLAPNTRFEGPTETQISFAKCFKHFREKSQ